MPALPDDGQSTNFPPNPASAWFATASGLAILDSERELIVQALSERPAQPWLWLAPTLLQSDADTAHSTTAPGGRGLRLSPHGIGWHGPVHCGLPWPMASESFSTVVLQHVTRSGDSARVLLQECARILSPDGALWLFELNPLAPYRWRWRGSGLNASEPLTWRRQLRDAGLFPAPLSQGVGPRWRTISDATVQDGPGLRAAYALRADKRTVPLTPLRNRALRLENASAA